MGAGSSDVASKPGHSTLTQRTIFLFALIMASLMLLPSGSSPSRAEAQTTRTTYAVVAWGCDCEGATQVPQEARSGVRAISASSHYALALKNDGTVIAWGSNYSGQRDVPEGLTDVKDIAAGYLQPLALKEDGSVVAWGNYGYPSVPDGLENVKAISAGEYHSLALKEDGTVVAWSNHYAGNDYGQTDVPEGLTRVKAISTSGAHNLALKYDGTIVAWGNNNFGQTNVPEGLTDVKAISAGYYGSLALKEDGTVVGWGKVSSIPANLTNVKAIAAGASNFLALREDGTVVAWGSDYFGEKRVPAGLKGVKDIAAGGFYGLALAELTPPPGPVESFTASARDSKVALSWIKPDEEDLWYTRILKSTTGFATKPEPEGDQVRVADTLKDSYSDYPLSNDRTYYYTAFARDATGSWSVAATASATPTDITGPTITDFTPDGTRESAFDRRVIAYFDEPMDEASINISTFILKKQGADRRVAANVRYEEVDGLGNRAILDPDERLESGATYTVTLSTGVKDLAGNSLKGTRSWSFIVSNDTTPPEVTSTTPEDGATNVQTTASVIATFSEDMRKGSLNTNTVKLRKSGTKTDIPATVVYNVVSRTTNLDPNGSLEAGQSYTMFITGKDRAGNSLPEQKMWSFTTAQ